MSARTKIWLTMGCTIPALTFVEVDLLVRFEQSNGAPLRDWAKIINAILAYVNLYLCRDFAERIFKGIIWSRSSQVFERPAEKGAGIMKGGDDADGFEVRDRTRSRIAALGYATIGLVFLVFLAWGLYHGQPRDLRVYWLFALIVGVPLGMALICWYLPPGLHVGSDSMNISGKAFGIIRDVKGVPWSRVSTCEIVTFYERNGKPILTQPIFKDASGKALLSLDLMALKMADQERFVKYIKTRLPRSPSETWEL